MGLSMAFMASQLGATVTCGSVLLRLNAALSISLKQLAVDIFGKRVESGIQTQPIGELSGPHWLSKQSFLTANHVTP